MADSNDHTRCSPAIQGILAAAQFAAEKHADQKRKGVSGEPYINHLIEVAGLIARSIEPVDENLIMAALLHDTIEDTGTTAAELEAKFGHDVASLVLEVTDDKSLPKETRKRLQIETAPKKSVRAQMLKLADKISNLRSIIERPPADWSLERKRQYFEWARQVVDGLSSPDPVLKAEFDRIYARFNEIAL